MRKYSTRLRKVAVVGATYAALGLVTFGIGAAFAWAATAPAFAM